MWPRPGFVLHPSLEHRPERCVPRDHLLEFPLIPPYYILVSPMNRRCLRMDAVLQRHLPGHCRVQLYLRWAFLLLLHLLRCVPRGHLKAPADVRCEHRPEEADGAGRGGQGSADGQPPSQPSRSAACCHLSHISLVISFGNSASFPEVPCL